MVLDGEQAEVKTELRRAQKAADKLHDLLYLNEGYAVSGTWKKGDCEVSPPQAGIAIHILSRLIQKAWLSML